MGIVSRGACAPVLLVDATGIVKKKPEKLGKKKLGTAGVQGQTVLSFNMTHFKGSKIPRVTGCLD